MSEAKAVDRSLRTSTDRRVERSRAAILKAVVELILEEGFVGCTIDSVVKRTGIARATIYRHWASRELLLSEVIDRLREAAPIPDTGGLRDDLIELFTAVSPERPHDESTFSDSIHTVLGIFQASSNDPSFAPLLTKLIDALASLLGVLLRRAIERGELGRDADLDTITNLVLGAFIIRQGFRNQPLTAAYAATVVDMVLAGSPRPGASSKIADGAFATVKPHR